MIKVIDRLCNISFQACASLRLDLTLQDGDLLLHFGHPLLQLGWVLGLHQHLACPAGILIKELPDELRLCLRFLLLQLLPQFAEIFADVGQGHSDGS